VQHWPDYGVHAGWFLLFTHREKAQDFIVCIFNDTLCARTFAAWT
jgi:hypothetical protein